MKQKVSTRLIDLCNAAAVITNLKDGENILVGTMIGVAQDTVERTDQVGEKFSGLSGVFELTPAITDKDKGGREEATKAGQLFLPGPIFDAINIALQKVLYPNPEKPDKKSRGSVEFAAKVFVMRKAKGKFDWQVQPVVDPVATDPLAHLRRALGGKAAPEAAPSTTEPGAPSAKKK